MDLFTYALAKANSEGVGSGSGGGTAMPQVQADWDQNDESQVDYIKNRPFYEETSTYEKEWKSYDWIIPETLEDGEMIYINYSLGLQENQPYVVSFTEFLDETDTTGVKTSTNIIATQESGAPCLGLTLGSELALYDGIKLSPDFSGFEEGDFATLYIGNASTFLGLAPSLKDRKITFCKLANEEASLVDNPGGTVPLLGLQENWTYTVSLLKDNTVVSSFTKNPFKPAGAPDGWLYLTETTNFDSTFGFAEETMGSDASYVNSTSIDADTIAITGVTKNTVTETKVQKIPNKFLPEIPTVSIATIDTTGTIKATKSYWPDYERRLPIFVDEDGSAYAEGPDMDSVTVNSATYYRKGTVTLGTSDVIVDGIPVGVDSNDRLQIKIGVATAIEPTSTSIVSGKAVYDFLVEALTEMSF